MWVGHQARKAKHAAAGNGFGYRMYDANSPYTSTITARYGKDGSEILIKQDGNPRKVTPREAARLQGFPDSFVIPVSDSQAYKQFGNSVAVPVIDAIAKQLVSCLN
jgi:DNA (cytosine-5)-methyltransferase 1